MGIWTLCSLQRLHQQPPVFSDVPEALKGSLFCCSGISCKVISWCFSQLHLNEGLYLRTLWIMGSWESIWLEDQSCLPFLRIMDSNFCWQKPREMKQQTLCEIEGNKTFGLTKTWSSHFLIVPFYSSSKCCLVSIGPRPRENRHSDYSWRPFWNNNFTFLCICVSSWSHQKDALY